MSVGAPRLATAVTAIALLLAGCASAARTPTSVAGGPTTTAPPAVTEPAVTEPLIGPDQLTAILLHPADLPAGFGPAAASDLATGAPPSTLCGRPLVDTTGATAQVEQLLVRSIDHLRLAEQLAGFASAAAGGVPLNSLRALGAACPRDGVITVTPFAPAAVGEDEAGLRLASPAGVVDVAMIRSGPLVTVVMLSGSGTGADRSLPQVVHAAGVKLALGTGG